MSDDPDREEVARAVAEKLVGYEGAYAAGAVDVDGFLRAAEPDLRVDGVAELLRYRFLGTGLPNTDTRPATDDRRQLDMSAFDDEDRPGQPATERSDGTPVGVRDFLALLPARLRTLDPTVDYETVRQRGRVEGRIDWRETVSYRARAGGAAENTVVTRVSEPGVASDRNRVLVKLLSRLRETAREGETAFADTEGGAPVWLDGWGQEGALRETVVHALDADPHLSHLGPTPVTDRTVASVAGDPDPLYAEAAALLAAFRRIGGDLETTDAEQLADLFLIDTFEPDAGDRHEGSTVYELYWALKLLDEVPSEHLARFDTDGDQVLSRWETDETEYLLCHDTNGRVELDGVGEVDLASFVDPRGWETDLGEPTSRRGYLRDTYVEIADGSDVGRTFDDDTRKEPDIVVFALDRDPDDGGQRVLHGLFVGEVKHSTDNPYLRKGLREVVQYAAFARVGDDARLPPGVNGPAVGDAEFLGERLELGLFVGEHEDELSTVDREDAQVRGWGDDPDRPLDSNWG